MSDPIVYMLEPFDEMNTGAGDLPKRFDALTGGTITAGSGVKGTKGLVGTLGTNSVSKNINVNRSRAFLSAHFFPRDLTASLLIFALLDATATQIQVNINATMRLELLRGATVLATSTGTVSPDVFCHIGFLAEIADAGGIAEVWLNGGKVINFSGDTKNSAASAFAPTVRFGYGSAWVLDNCLVVVGTGTSYIPEGHIVPLYAGADGDVTQWTPSSGTTHYLLVNENGPSMGGFVSASGTTQKELYDLQTLNYVSGSILAIEHLIYADKDEPVAKNVVQITKLGGVEYDGNQHALSTTPTYYSTIQKQKPGGGDWTIADVNALQVGQRTEP